MASTLLFDGVPGANYAPSRPFVLSVGTPVSLDFEIVITVAARIDWYMEFTSAAPADPATTWFQEVAEEDQGAGATNMPPVVRSFPGAALTLAAATRRFSCHFVRAHAYGRVQLRLGVGTVTALRIWSAIGATPSG